MSPNTQEPTDRDYALREREVRAKETEVATKQEDLKRSRWLNPTVIGLFAATIGLFGNLAVARINATTEKQRVQASVIIEASKALADGKGTACPNLIFFVRLKVLDDVDGNIARTCPSDPDPQKPLLPPSFPVSPSDVSDSVWALAQPEQGWCYQEKTPAGLSAHCHLSEERCNAAKAASNSATKCLLVEDLRHVAGWHPVSRGWMNSWYQLRITSPLPAPFPQF